MNRVLYACLISFFFWCLLHVLPVKASTNYVSIDSADAQLFESAGVFKNPEFFQGAYGWELTGCVSIPVSYGSATFPYANRSLNITCLAETLSIKQCTDKFANLQAYVNAYGSVTIGSSLGNDVYWRVTDGTNTLYEEKVPDDGKLHLMNAPLLFAQDNLCIEIASDGDITGTVALTQNNIEVNKNTSLIGILADSTGWEDKGPITIESTTTDPTLGTVNKSEVKCRRSGSNLELEYELDIDGGTAGSGDYLFSIVDCAGSTGLEIDESVVNFYTDAVGSNGYNAVSNWGTWEWSNAGNSTAEGKVVPYDSTRFRLLGRLLNISPTIQRGAVSSSFLNFSSAITLTVRASVPIKQWRLGTTGIAQRRDFDNLDNHAYFTASIDDAASITSTLPWLDSCSDGSTKVCSFSSNVFTSAPYCFATNNTTAGDPIAARITAISASSISVQSNNASGEVDSGFNLVCFKNFSDYQKAFADYIAGLLRQSSIVQDVEQFPTTEQKLCDACAQGEALYKRCHYVSSDITTTGTIANWSINLKPFGKVKYNATTFFIEGNALSADNRAYVVYDQDTGTLRSIVNGSLFLAEGSNICMTYTKD